MGLGLNGVPTLCPSTPKAAIVDILNKLMLLGHMFNTERRASKRIMNRGLKRYVIHASSIMALKLQRNSVHSLSRSIASETMQADAHQRLDHINVN